MATLVNSVEDLGGVTFIRRGFAVPRGYVDADSDKDIRSILNFVPDDGEWAYTVQDNPQVDEETGDVAEHVAITVYWTNLDGEIVVTTPTAGKREREEQVTAVLESKKSRSDGDAGDQADPPTPEMPRPVEVEDPDHAQDDGNGDK